MINAAHDDLQWLAALDAVFSFDDLVRFSNEPYGFESLHNHYDSHINS